MDFRNFDPVTMTVEEIVDRLAAFPIFSTVPREQLQHLARVAYVVSFNEFILKPGDHTEELIIVLQGRMRTYNIQNGQQKELVVWGAGMISGLIPFSRMTVSPVYTEALEPVIGLIVHKSNFQELIQQNYELTAVFVHTLIDRARQFTSFHFQSEKLMALGKLSAGLAHELNNPVAAIVRSAEDLHTMAGSLSESLGMIRALPINEEEWTRLCPIFDERSVAERPRLALMERSRREDEIVEWLSERDMPEDYADALVDAGYSPEYLDQISRAVRPESVAPLMSWIEKQLRMDKTVEEIAQAGRRISTLVTSIKSYTRMDQVHDMQDVSINEGIRNTLTILQHKARKNSINVHEELGESIPAVRGFPGELTQVWTNLIDNALDAMKDGGDLYLSTGMDGRAVYFDVRDTGPGIPKENLERIFDPFFTTKDIGEGTGVGLDIVHKVLTSHNATIAVDSEPGRTEFRVCFPL
jgi:signal transduction histidine kinase